MNINLNVHHYHHLGADDLKLYLQIQKQLHVIKEKLFFMSEEIATRQQLNDAIGNLIGVVTNGFDTLGTTVSTEIGEVVAALEAKSGQREDLSAEVAKLRALTATVEVEFDGARAAVEHIFTSGAAAKVIAATTLAPETISHDQTEAAPGSETESSATVETESAQTEEAESSAG